MPSIVDHHDWSNIYNLYTDRTSNILNGATIIDSELLCIFFTFPGDDLE